MYTGFNSTLRTHTDRNAGAGNTMLAEPIRLSMNTPGYPASGSESFHVVPQRPSDERQNDDRAHPANRYRALVPGPETREFVRPSCDIPLTQLTLHPNPTHLTLRKRGRAPL